MIGEVTVALVLFRFYSARCFWFHSARSMRRWPRSLLFAAPLWHCTCSEKSAMSVRLLFVAIAVISVMAALAGCLTSAKVTVRPCCCQAVMVAAPAGMAAAVAEEVEAAEEPEEDGGARVAAGAGAGAEGGPPRMAARGSWGDGVWEQGGSGLGGGTTWW